MKQTKHYSSLKASYSGQLGYISVLFGWLDKDDIPANDSCPNSCRGILCAGIYSDKMDIRYGNSNGMRADFEFVVDYCNLCLVIRDEALPEIQLRIDYLNSIKSNFGIEDDFTLTDLNWDKFPGVNNYTAYKLNGHRKWISSAPIISFFTGIIKYGVDSPAVVGSADEVKRFIKAYAESDLCTDDVELIKKEFTKNYDTLHGYCGAHNYGCERWLNHWNPIDIRNKLAVKFNKKKSEKILDNNLSLV